MSELDKIIMEKFHELSDAQKEAFIITLREIARQQNERREATACN